MSAAIVSFVWPNAQGVLLELAALGRRSFVVDRIRSDVLGALQARQVDVQALQPDQSGMGERALRTAAAAGAARLPGLAVSAGFDRDEAQGVVAVAERVLVESLGTAIALIDALEAVRTTRGVELLLISEAETGHGATAAAWARRNRIPVALIGHGLLLGSYHGASYAPTAVDAVFVAGPRGMDNQIEGGVARERCFPLGAPWFDELAARASQLGAARDTVRERWGVPRDASVMLFATSFLHKLTAVDDPERERHGIERFVAGCAVLRESGIDVEIVVKGRPAVPHDVATAMIDDVSRKLGVGGVRYVTGDMGEAIAACDVLVVQDSAAALEAAVLGIPSVNLWDPSLWTAGPAFAEPDGLALAVEPADFRGLVAPLLSDPEARRQTVERLRAALPSFHAAQPAGSARAIAAKIDALFPASPVARRHVWQLLSEPADAASDPQLQRYYANARPEVVALVDRAPRRAIEFGCAGGATGAAIKARYPSAEVIGVELNPSAAAIARTRLDRVLSEDIERLDYAAHGIVRGSVDAVIFADVLEHLRDPWLALTNLRPFLAPAAQVVCSIPNVRNLWLIESLVAGNWTYEPEGLLDVTHIRFFTLREMHKMFAETGYVVERVNGIGDPRGGNLPPTLPVGQNDVTTPHTVFRGVTQADYDELRTIQFLIVARPGP